MLKWRGGFASLVGIWYCSVRSDAVWVFLSLIRTGSTVLKLFVWILILESFGFWFWNCLCGFWFLDCLCGFSFYIVWILILELFVFGFWFWNSLCGFWFEIYCILSLKLCVWIFILKLFVWIWFWNCLCGFLFWNCVDFDVEIVCGFRFWWNCLCGFWLWDCFLFCVDSDFFFKILRLLFKFCLLSFVYLFLFVPFICVLFHRIAILILHFDRNVEMSWMSIRNLKSY